MILSLVGRWLHWDCLLTSPASPQCPRTCGKLIAGQGRLLKARGLIQLFMCHFFKFGLRFGIFFLRFILSWVIPTHHLVYDLYLGCMFFYPHLHLSKLYCRRHWQRSTCLLQSRLLSRNSRFYSSYLLDCSGIAQGTPSPQTEILLIRLPWDPKGIFFLL